jgi:hypothetical protein
MTETTKISFPLLTPELPGFRSRSLGEIEVEVYGVGQEAWLTPGSLELIDSEIKARMTEEERQALQNLIGAET